MAQNNLKMQLSDVDRHSDFNHHLFLIINKLKSFFLHHFLRPQPDIFSWEGFLLKEATNLSHRI